jgi:hypothetical protein
VRSAQVRVSPMLDLHCAISFGDDSFVADPFRLPCLTFEPEPVSDWFWCLSSFHRIAWHSFGRKPCARHRRSFCFLWIHHDNFVIEGLTVLTKIRINSRGSP